MLNTNCYDFSFSGLKTHVTQLVDKTKLTNELVSDIAFDFENAILDVLISKTLKAAIDLNIDSIVVSGGVSANKRLRERFENEKRNKNIFFPDIAFSTDNGAMIAYMGYLKYDKALKNSLEINPNPSSRLV
jgi:N6-L-threonylcarbamoyladenine synthase